MLELSKNPFERLGQTIRNYCPATRWIAIGFIALIVVSLIWLFVGGSLPLVQQRELLFGGQKFSDGDLISMESAFARARLSDYKIIDKSIEIPASKKMAYIAVLADGKSLPRNFNQHLDEIVGDISLFDAPATRDLKLKIGRQKALAEIINSMDGLSQAAVLWDVEKVGGLSPKTLVRASVSLRTNPGTELTDQQVSGIRQMVAYAVAGLQPGNVAVSDTRTGICYTQEVPPPTLETGYGSNSASNFAPFADSDRLSADRAPLGATERDDGFSWFSRNRTAPNASVNPEKDPDCQRRMRAESFWNQKIERLLSLYVQGAVVQSTVEFAEYQSQLEKRVEHDSEPTIYRSVVEENTDRSLADSRESRGMAESADSISNSSPNSSPENAPLAVAFGVNQPRSLEQRDSLATITSTVRKTEDGLLGGTVTVTQKDPASQISVCAAIAIPQEYLVQICRRYFQLSQNQMPTSEQIRQAGERQVQQFLQLVGNILPQREGRAHPEKFLHFVFTDVPAVRTVNVPPAGQYNGQYNGSYNGPVDRYGAGYVSQAGSGPLFEQTSSYDSDAAPKSGASVGDSEANSPADALVSVRSASIDPNIETIAPNSGSPNVREPLTGNFPNGSSAKNPSTEIAAISQPVSDSDIGNNIGNNSKAADNSALSLSAPPTVLPIDSPTDSPVPPINGAPADANSVSATLPGSLSANPKEKMGNRPSDVSPEQYSYIHDLWVWAQSLCSFKSLSTLPGQVWLGIGIVVLSLIVLLIGFYRFFVRRRKNKDDRSSRKPAEAALVTTDIPGEANAASGQEKAAHSRAGSGSVSGSDHSESESFSETNPALAAIDCQDNLDSFDGLSLKASEVSNGAEPTSEPTSESIGAPQRASLETVATDSSSAVPTAPLTAASDEASRDSSASSVSSTVQGAVRRDSAAADSTDTPSKSSSAANLAATPAAIAAANPTTNPAVGQSNERDRIRINQENALPAAETSTSNGFSLLESVDNQRLAQILSVERPQTAALALSQLSDEKAGAVLAYFSEDYRPKVVQRLLRLENPAPEILADVVASLCERAKRFVEGDENPARLDCKAKTMGKERISRILAASDVAVGRQILSSLKQVDENLIDEWVPESFKFDDLVSLDASSLNNLFDAAEPEEVLLAFVGVPQTFLNRITALLPSPCGQRLKKDLWTIGPTRLSDVEEARRRIVQLARDLVVQGRIKLSAAPAA